MSRISFINEGHLQLLRNRRHILTDDTLALNTSEIRVWIPMILTSSIVWFALKLRQDQGWRLPAIILVFEAWEVQVG